MYIHNKLVIVIMIAIFLAGCGGGNGSFSPDFSGNYGGGQILLGSDRAGGPVIEIDSFSVQQSDGSFGTYATLLLPGEDESGFIGGSISRQGLFNAVVNLSYGGQIVIGGGPLRKKIHGRAGSAWEVTGRVSVSYHAEKKGTKQYLNSALSFWP